MQIKLSWTGYSIPEISSIKALYDEDPEAGMTYKYTGEATLTFVDRGGSRPVFYLQDKTAAIALGDDYEMLTKTDYEVGDKITGTILGVQSALIELISGME